MWILLIVVLILLFCWHQRSETYELNPEWEYCEPCFRQCTKDLWSGKLIPPLGETPKDMCAKKCSRWCAGFEFQFGDSIQKEEHGSGP